MKFKLSGKSRFPIIPRGRNRGPIDEDGHFLALLESCACAFGCLREDLAQKTQPFEVFTPRIFSSQRSSKQCFAAVSQLPIPQATRIFSTSMGRELSQRTSRIFSLYSCFGIRINDVPIVFKRVDNDCIRHYRQ
jgi:hypothetical protein